MSTFDYLFSLVRRYTYAQLRDLFTKLEAVDVLLAITINSSHVSLQLEGFGFSGVSVQVVRGLPASLWLVTSSAGQSGVALSSLLCCQNTRDP